MAARLGPADAVGGSPAYSGRAWRQTLLGPVLGGATAARPLGAQSGVRPGTSQTIVTATSTTWTVTPFAGIADVETAAEAGAYGFAFDTNQTGSVNAAHATWPRWDILSVQIDDPGESDGTSTPASRVLYTAGTAASSPAEPAVPARAVRICRIVVPQSGGGSPSVIWEAPALAAAGAMYLNPPTDQKTALNALATATGPVWIDDQGVLYRSVGAGWVKMARPIVDSGKLTDSTPTVAFTLAATGWTHYAAAGWSGIGLWNHDGRIELSGVGAKASWAANDVILTLQPAFRPPANRQGWAQVGTSLVQVIVTASTGAVSITASGTGSANIFVSYDLA